MTSELDDFALDDAFFEAPTADTAEADVPGEAPEEDARRAAMDAFSQTLRQYRDEAEEARQRQTPQEDDSPAADGDAENKDISDAPEEEPVDTGPDIPDFANRGSRGGNSDDDPEGYDDEEDELPRRGIFNIDLSGFRERVLEPLVRLIATRLARTQMQQDEAANWPDPVDIRDTPELSPKRAGKYYASLLRPMRLRLRIATVLCIALAWISFRFPMAGMLRVSLPLQAGVSVVLTLAVMMAALDIFTAGLRQLFDLRPGAEALVSVAAILSCIDGVLVLLGHGDSLPFCAIGATALTAALWGQRLSCTALRRTFKAASASRSPSVMTAEKKGDREEKYLSRSNRGTVEGVVRRSEGQDLCQTAYAIAAPIMLGVSLLLAILASLGGNGHFLHTLSALISVCGSFSAFFSFPLPYAIATRKLRNSGVALAGYAGCAEIGKTRRIIIGDEDLFPPGTMRFSEINVQEGVFLGKVVSCTASLISASGSGVTAIFEDLVTRRGYHIPGVVDFVCHEGGGLSGLISGERVLVGSAGFMNLMGIRLPQNLNTKNAICTAISGELVGVFVIDYIPVTSVQDALVTLLRGRTQTVFAIRDFNITPLMISKLFRIRTESFNFPSFRERYSISESAEDESALPAAVLTRSGMLPMVEAAETGRRVYQICCVSTVLSLVGAVIGMLFMFLLCRAGSFDTATVGNVLSFMLLWTLPVAILSIEQIRQ